MEWGDRGDELPWHGALGQNRWMSIRLPDLPHNLPLSRGHLGTARNATGHYVVDVVEFPEWCSRLGEYCQG